MTTSLPMLEAEGLSVRYALAPAGALETLRGVWVAALRRRRPDDDGACADGSAQAALRDVSLSLARGEILGLIGRNGAGKTTLLQVLAGVFEPDSGRLVRRGRVGGLLSLGAGFNAQLTGRENVRLNAALLGVPRARVEAELERVVGFSDLAGFVDRPVRTYSAGMRARLGFAVALLVDPDVVLLDEVLRVGDAAFREKAGSLLDRFREAGKSIVLASHSPEVVRRHCDRVLWLDRGSVRAVGRPAEILPAYLEDARREQDRIGAAI